MYLLANSSATRVSVSRWTEAKVSRSGYLHFQLDLRAASKHLRINIQVAQPWKALNALPWSRTWAPRPFQPPWSLTLNMNRFLYQM